MREIRTGHCLPARCREDPTSSVAAVGIRPTEGPDRGSMILKVLVTRCTEVCLSREVGPENC